MKLSTKNIDKTIRTVRRVLRGERVGTSLRCLQCGKRVKQWVAFVNGFGGLNYYHPRCALTRNQP